MKKSLLAAAMATALLTITGTGMILNSHESPSFASSETPAPVEPRSDNALPTVAFKLAVAPTGNSGRYLIQEQLVGFDLASQAIGETRDVAGEIAFDSTGQVIAAASRIQIGVSSLRSDSERRDGFVRGRILETDRYPKVEFVPTGVQGISMPLPTSGTRTFSLLGNLTIRGVTRPTTWTVQALFTAVGLSGTASTKFAFSDFGLTQPRVPVVLSVADTIQLEHTFALLRDEP